MSSLKRVAAADTSASVPRVGSREAGAAESEAKRVCTTVRMSGAAGAGVQAMTKLRVASLNVLYENYYQRYCKVERVPLDVRARMFLHWLPTAFAKHDVIAFQEWPYGGEQKYWGRVLNEAARRAGWNLVHMDQALWDGLLFAVNAATWDIEGWEFWPFTPATGYPGTKHRARLILRHRHTRATVGIINAHVPYASDPRQSEYNVTEVFELVDERVTPHWCAVGDWNVAAPRGDASAFYSACFPEGWVDATAAANHDTCMHDAPMKIDYIAHGPSLRVESVEVHPSRPHANVQHANPPPDPLGWFSDHSLVYATLEVPHGTP